jgi:hypothetical protein
MLGPRMLLRLVVAVALALLATALVPPSAFAASRSHDVTPVSGSRHYLVYVQQAYRSGKPVGHATLMYTRAHGKPHRIAKVRGWSVDRVRQAGPMVLYPAAAGAAWQWRNLRTGDSGTIPSAVRLPGTPPADWSTTGHVVQAAPNGWIVVRDALTPGATPPAGGQYWLQRTDGSLTPFAAPSSGSVADRPSDSLIAWDGGVRSGAPAGASVMRFDEPGVYQQLGASGDVLRCASANRSAVACAAFGSPGFLGFRVYDADSGDLLLEQTGHCANDWPFTPGARFAVVGRGLAWVTTAYGTCGAHRLMIETGAGKVAEHSGRWSHPVAALGGVAVSMARRGAAKIVLFTSAHHHRTIAR